MSEKHTIDVKANSVAEIVVKLIYAERIMNREPNTIILSELTGHRLLHEMEPTRFGNPSKDIKEISGASLFFGLNVIIIKGDFTEFIKVFEAIK